MDLGHLDPAVTQGRFDASGDGVVGVELDDVDEPVADDFSGIDRSRRSRRICTSIARS